MTPLKACCYLISTALSCLVYAFFLASAFRSHLRFGKKRTALILGLWVLTTALRDVLFFEVESPLRGYLSTVVILITLLDVGVAFLVFRNGPLQILFGLFMLYTFQRGVVAAAGLLARLAPLPLLTADFPNLNYLLYLNLALALTIPPLQYLFGNLLRRAVTAGIDFIQWRVFFLLPLTFFIYGLCSSFGGSLAGPATWGKLANLLLLNFFAYTTYWAAITILIYSYDKYEVGRRMEAATLQVTLERERYAMLSDHIAQTDRLLHDWRHHMISFRSYADRGDLPGLNAYLNQLGEVDHVRETGPICARPAVDAILWHYLGKAAEHGVQVEHRVDIPEAFGQPDLDLCIVFGNLTENALEACLRQTAGPKFIRVTADCIGGKMLAVCVENSFDGPVLRRDGIYQSSKREGPGMGLSSVKNIAEQRDGTFRATAENGVFAVEVLLNT